MQVGLVQHAGLCLWILLPACLRRLRGWRVAGSGGAALQQAVVGAMQGRPCENSPDEPIACRRYWCPQQLSCAALFCLCCTDRAQHGPAGSIRKGPARRVLLQYRDQTNPPALAALREPADHLSVCNLSVGPLAGRQHTGFSPSPGMEGGSPSSSAEGTPSTSPSVHADGLEVAPAPKVALAGPCTWWQAVISGWSAVRCRPGRASPPPANPCCTAH